MNYNYVLYNNLTEDDLKRTAVIVLLSLLFLFALMKFIKKISRRRKISFQEREEFENKIREMNSEIMKEKNLK